MGTSCCGGALGQLGTDVSLMLTAMPGELQSLALFSLAAHCPWLAHRRKEHLTFPIQGPSSQERNQCWKWAQDQTLLVPGLKLNWAQDSKMDRE